MYSFHRYRSDYRELLKLGFPIMIGYLGVIVGGFAVGFSAGSMMMGRFGYLTKRREMHG